MSPFRNLHIWIVGVSMLAILIATTWLINSWREDSGKERGRDQQVKGGDKGAPGKDKDNAKEPEKPREDPAVLEERRALSKVRLTGIRNLKIEIGETLTTLEQEVTTWETRIPALLKGVDGKKIAADSTRAEQFAGVLEKDPVSKTRVKQMREQLETLIAPIERAILDANSTYSPSPTIVAEIQTLGGDARSKLRDFREIKAVVDTLQTDSALTPPSEKTLEKVISDLEAEKARRRAELIRKTKAEEHDSESKRLATAEGKAEQELANARLALLKARTEAEKQGIDLQTDDLKRKTDEAKAAEQKRVDKAKREAKFDAAYPAMKAYLVPITSPGFKQFKGTALEMTETKGPMSLTCLQGNVKKSEAATGYFARNISTFWNDRPLGAFPPFSVGGAGVTPQAYEIWYRVQDFIAEFGDIMVERKLLAP